MRMYVVTIRSVHYVDVMVEATSTVDAMHRVREYGPDLALTDLITSGELVTPATVIRARAHR